MPGPGIELIGEEEIAEVMQVLTNRSLSRYGREDDPNFGAKVRQVEQHIAGLAGVRFGLGLSGGGSSGLLVSLMGLGIGPGDEVIVPGFTYVASISAIVYARATPGPGRGRRLVQPRSGRCRGADHAADSGDHRRAHARCPGPTR